jgi:hypothetical protein
VVGNIKRCISDFSEDTGLKGFGFYLGLRVWLNPTVPVHRFTLRSIYKHRYLTMFATGRGCCSEILEGRRIS